MLIGAGHSLLWRLGWLRSARVLEGEEGWLFLGDTFDNTISKSRGLARFTPEQASRWADQYDAMRDALGELGAELRLVIVPDKQSVYPQHLPAWARNNAEDGSAMTDQILNALRKRGSNGILDLRPVLRESALHQQIYWKTDSHWNPAGAIVAAQQVLPWLWPEQSGVVPALLARCSVVLTGATTAGDLGRILGVAEFPGEPWAELKLTDSRFEASAPWRGAWGLQQPFRTSVQDGISGRLLVLGDSFLDSWWFLLADLSRETAYFHHQFLQVSRDLLDRERPSIVLVFIVERALPMTGPAIVP